jgi:hypothetical protein
VTGCSQDADIPTGEIHPVAVLQHDVRSDIGDEVAEAERRVAQFNRCRLGDTSVDQLAAGLGNEGLHVDVPVGDQGGVGRMEDNPAPDLSRMRPARP